MSAAETKPTTSSLRSSIEKLALNSRGRQFAILVLICAATLWIGLGSSRLWDRDEPRNARCAVEMMERGDWVIPMFNDQLRTHKPILLYWLQMICYRLLGETDFAARAASAAMATLAVLATYWLGLRLIDASTGFWSAATLATSLMFIVAGRAATPDACLVATSTLGIVGLALHWQTGSFRWTRYACMGYTALGFAVLAKGPVGIVLPLIVVPLWGLVQSSNTFWIAPIVTCRDLVRRLRIAPGLLMAIAIATPWYIWVGIRTDGEWLRGFFFEHNIGRAVSAMEGHRGGWWFYPLASFVGLFPWSLMLIPIGLCAATQFRKHLRSPALQLGLIWLGVYIAVFSIAKTKLPSYITPGYPGAALIIGSFLSQWANRSWQLSASWLKIGASVHALIGASIASAIAYLSLRESMPKLLPYAGLGIGFLIVAVWMMIAIRKANQHRLPWAMLACSATFLGGLFSMASSSVAVYRTDLNAILTERETADSDGQTQPTEWISLRTIEPSWVYYLKTPIVEMPLPASKCKSPNDETIERVAQLLQKPSGRVIIDADRVPELERILAEQFHLATKRAVTFKCFLKSNEIVVLRNAATANAQASLLRLHR